MVDYILPPLGVEFEYLQVFPIWGPLAVSIEISFGFTIDLHSVGFDTYGYQRYADGGFRNPGVIFDGFYLNDLDAEGVDAPEVLFEFGLVGAAELNLGIARAGVGGGIKAEIYFDWYDPIADGRVHISEMVGQHLGQTQPAGGIRRRRRADLPAVRLPRDQHDRLRPGVPDHAGDRPSLTLRSRFERPPVLATKADDTLILNIGPNAEDRLNGNTSDGDEEHQVDVCRRHGIVTRPRSPSARRRSSRASPTSSPSAARAMTRSP